MTPPDHAVLQFLEPEFIVAVPACAQPLYIALMHAYVDSGGEIEVFTERLDDGSSSMRIRPANVHGHLEILFDPEGAVKDVLWDSCTGPPPRPGDKKA